ncbi:MAG: fatty acid desaturase family protein [Bacteroidia bacterium]
MNHYTSLSHDVQKAFAADLQSKVTQYFSERNGNKKGNLLLLFKGILAFLLFLLPYYFFIRYQCSFPVFLLLYTLHCVGQLFVAFHLAHDANHQALSSHKWVSKLGYFTFDLVGVNSYIWRIMHTRAHHSYTNIPEKDQSILGRGLFRFSPTDPLHPFHRYQHWYVFLFYGLVSLDSVFARDFKFLFAKADYNAPMQKLKHPIKEYLFLGVHKLFYVLYAFVIPFLYVELPAWQLITAFLLGHIMLGSIMAFAFQVTHTVESTYYPNDGRDFQNYAVHTLATTADYAPDNYLLTWVLGGLNLHVIHHIVPNVSHIHYFALTKILRTTAKEHNIPYRSNATFYEAILDHLRFLKTMGTDTFRNPV